MTPGTWHVNLSVCGSRLGKRDTITRFQPEHNILTAPECYHRADPRDPQTHKRKRCTNSDVFQRTQMSACQADNQVHILQSEAKC